MQFYDTVRDLLSSGLLLFQCFVFSTIIASVNFLGCIYTAGLKCSNVLWYRSNTTKGCTSSKKVHGFGYFLYQFQATFTCKKQIRFELDTCICNYYLPLSEHILSAKEEVLETMEINGNRSIQSIFYLLFFPVAM